MSSAKIRISKKEAMGILRFHRMKWRFAYFRPGIARLLEMKGLVTMRGWCLGHGERRKNISLGSTLPGRYSFVQVGVDDIGQPRLEVTEDGEKAIYGVRGACGLTSLAKAAIDKDGDKWLKAMEFGNRTKFFEIEL